MRTKGTKNKKEAMAHVSLFIPKETLAHFKETATKCGTYYTPLIREVLVQWAKNRK
jgi:hypothetical protein